MTGGACRPDVRLAADKHGGFAELRGRSPGGAAQRAPGRNPVDFTRRLDPFGNMGGSDFGGAGEIGGLAP